MSAVGETGVSAPAGGSEPRPRRVPWQPLAGPLLALAVVMSFVPIGVAAARAIANDWIPTGDNGLIYVRTTDVFSRHTPLLYTWSFASTQADQHFNHPGPLLFYLYAGPVALFGPKGLVVATALLNAASVLGIVLVARRCGGRLMTAAVVAVTAVLCWTLGSRLLSDPWSPDSLLLPFLLFLVLVWASGSGHLFAFPLMAAVGSLLLATNLGYGLLVPSLGLGAVVVALLNLRLRRRADPGSWPALRRRARRSAAWVGGVLAVCWAPTVIEQFTSQGKGNLSLILDGLGGDTSTLGLRGGVKLLAGVAVLPQWWLRGSLVNVYGDLPRFGVSVVALVGLTAVLVLCGWLAHRRRDTLASVGIVTAFLALAVGLLTVMRSPTYQFGANAPYQTRLLWPLAAFITLAIVASLARLLARDAAWTTALVAVLSLAAVVIAVLNLPEAKNYGLHEFDYAPPVMRDLARQVGDLEEEGTLFYDFRGDSFAYQFYSSGLLAELRRRGIPFVTDNEPLLRSLGEHRRFTGDNADATLTIRTGEAAHEVPRSAGRRVALHEGLPPGQRRELARLRSQIREYVDLRGVPLNPQGREAIERLQRAVGSPDENRIDAEELLNSGGLLGLYQRGFLALEEPWIDRFARWAGLQTRSDERTVAIFVAPRVRGESGSSSRAG